MDKFVDIGSGYACSFLELIAAFEIKTKLCLASGGNRYSVGVLFWLLNGAMATALFVAQRRANRAY